MRTLLLLVVLSVASLHAQDFYAAGATLDTTGAARVNGFAAWAKALNDAGTFTTTTYRIFTKSWQPFSYTTTVEQGIAQRVWSKGRYGLYLCAGAGVATGGDNVGYSASICGIGTAMLSDHWGLLTRAAGEKSSLVRGRGTLSLGVLYRR